MEAGELELRQAFEETATKNIKAVVAHSNDTRTELRLLEKKIELQDGIIRQLNEKIEALRVQVTSLQTKVFAGGT